VMLSFSNLMALAGHIWIQYEQRRHFRLFTRILLGFSVPPRIQFPLDAKKHS
jgi:hypothetical protein